MEISLITGQPFYAGANSNGNATEALRDVCRTLNIGEGKLSKITQSMTEKYFERVDREIDAQLEDLYYTPIKPYNLKRFDGTTVQTFPGIISQISLYWSSGLLLQSEFQGLENNQLDMATEYVTSSQKRLFKILKFNERLFGQEMKSRLRTMPPTFQPSGLNPEPDF